MSIDKTDANVAPVTEKQPFTAHAHGTSAGRTDINPMGNIMPIHVANGANIVTVTAIRHPKPNPPHQSNTGPQNHA
jgi:hypothetical protein